MTASMTPTQLFVREAGSPDAPAIVFLHGAGLSSREWLPQFEHLSDAFHCLAPDLPEEGQSVAIGPLTMARCVDDVSNLIRERAHGRAHVVGLSMGGAIAVTLLAQHPELVDRVLISGTAQPIGAVVAWINNLNAPILKMMSKDQVAKLMAKQFGIPPEFKDQVEDIKLLTPNAVMRTSAVLKDIVVPIQAENPVLVCVGEKETLVAKGAARKYVRTLKHATGVMAPGAGHVWNLQKPQLFSDTVRAWLTGSPLPGELLPLA